METNFNRYPDYDGFEHMADVGLRARRVAQAIVNFEYDGDMYFDSYAEIADTLVWHD